MLCLNRQALIYRAATERLRSNATLQAAAAAAAATVIGISTSSLVATIIYPSLHSKVVRCALALNHAVHTNGTTQIYAQRQSRRTRKLPASARTVPLVISTSMLTTCVRDWTWTAFVLTAFVPTAFVLGLRLYGLRLYFAQHTFSSHIALHDVLIWHGC